MKHFEGLDSHCRSFAVKVIKEEIKTKMGVMVGRRTQTAS